MPRLQVHIHAQGMPRVPGAQAAVYSLFKILRIDGSNTTKLRVPSPAPREPASR